jgi:hypothetical protein
LGYFHNPLPFQQLDVFLCHLVTSADSLANQL